MFVACFGLFYSSRCPYNIPLQCGIVHATFYFSSYSLAFRKGRMAVDNILAVFFIFFFYDQMPGQEAHCADLKTHYLTEGIRMCTQSNTETIPTAWRGALLRLQDHRGSRRLVHEVVTADLNLEG